ncbi:MAG: 30S ribosomal protein S1, partial [Ruminococcus sp.]|nr:30S ribosomal protein S1 [Ruminococcus sp.]
RIAHPSDRFRNGDFIHAVVSAKENGRIFLTHKELLGTWEENASLFSAGETVSGIVRSVEEYGIFVELAPNLAGLAEPRENIKAGQHVSVYIKALIPEKMKVKLIIVDTCEDGGADGKIKYYKDSGKINYWCYSTENSHKKIETVF